MAKNAYIRRESQENFWNNCKSMAEPVRRYFEDLRKHNYSEKTIYSYDEMLRRLAAYLAAEKITELSDVTLAVLEKFRAACLAANLAAVTVGTLVRVVRAFFNYLESEGIIFDNPAYGLKVPKAVKKLQYVPSETDMRKLLAQPDPATVIGVRDRAILEVAYSTGIRLEELTGLKLAGVDLGNGTVRVFGKGRKERTVPLTKAARHWLERYLTGARSELLKYNLNEDALWIGAHKGAMSHSALGVRIGEYSKAAGVRRISPHAIRRACATHLLRNGAHPVQVQMLLGHATLRTLSRYISVSFEDIRKTHAGSGAGR